MSKYYKIFSILIITATLVWLVFALMPRHPEKWHFLTAGAINFLMAMIINRQFTKKEHNYLGIIHVIFMVSLFGYGYFFI